jgi:hypothetical protein
MTMRVAICIHGKPRFYEKGYAVLERFMKKHTGIIFDIYLHAWVDTKEVENELLSIYNPVAYHFEEQREFDIELYKYTIAYKNSNIHRIKGFDASRNIQEKAQKTSCWVSISQIYSRYICKGLVKGEYDCVVTTRYDFLNDIDLDLNEIDLSMIYTNSCHVPRFLLNDNFLVFPLDKYKNVMNMYELLPTILNSKDVLSKMTEINEVLHINIEEILLASILFHNYEMYVIQTPLIPDFM